MEINGEEHDFDCIEVVVCKYLKDVGNKVKDVESLRGMADNVRELARGLKSKGTKQAVSGGEMADRYVDALAQLEDIEERLVQSVSMYEEAIEVAMTICPPSKVENFVVWLRVAMGMRWSQVSNEVKFSGSHVRRLYKDGIVRIYEEMPWIWQRKTIPDAQPRAIDPPSDRM